MKPTPPLDHDSDEIAHRAAHGAADLVNHIADRIHSIAATVGTVDKQKPLDFARLLSI